MMRAAIITGGSSGIGAALARRLAREQFGIVLVGRDRERLHAVQAALRREGGTVEAVEADIGDPTQALRPADACRRVFGRIDLLINNAGIGHYHPFAEMPTAAARRVTETNWLGTLDMTASVLPTMLAQRAGAIVNIASIGALTGVPNRSVYCATKAAVRHWSRSLYLELRPHGVQVLCVLPSGTASTRFFENVLGHPPVVHAVPGRLMTPEAVAEAIWRAIRMKKRELILSPLGKMIDLVNRISPQLADAVVDWQHRRTAREGQETLRPDAQRAPISNA